MLSLVDQILKRVDAVTQFQILQTALEEESQRRIEFREWIKEGDKAEFINGEVILHKPSRFRHWNTSSLLSSVLSIFVTQNHLGSVGVGKVMIELSRNDYEPDIVFFSEKKAATFTDDQMYFPAPDFVVEILSPETRKIDTTIKKEDYALHGVAEYWIVDPIKYRVQQYILPSDSKKYFPAKVHQSNAYIESTAIKGFELSVEAIFESKVNLKTITRFLE